MTGDIKKGKIPQDIKEPLSSRSIPITIATSICLSLFLTIFSTTQPILVPHLKQRSPRRRLRLQTLFLSRRCVLVIRDGNGFSRSGFGPGSV